MPSPTPSLTTASARDLIREAAFPGTTGDRVGVEIEWLTSPSQSPRSVSDLRGILEPQLPLPRGSKITFEPGGQLELSSRVMKNCGAAINAVAQDTGTVRSALKPHGVELTASGIDPHRPLKLSTNEPRYTSMKAYFDGANRAGAHMMCTTAAVHVNLDAGADAEGHRRWKLAHQIGPMLVAAFANSPIVQGRPSGWLSSRMAAWLAIDNTRAAPALNGADPRDAWASYALRANVMFLRTHPEYQPMTRALPFEVWIERGHELGHPTADDLAYHLTTLFPPVRPKGWLELRMIDMVPDPWWRAAVVITTALVCDEQASAIADRSTQRDLRDVVRGREIRSPSSAYARVGDGLLPGRARRSRQDRQRPTVVLGSERLLRPLRERRPQPGRRSAGRLECGRGTRPRGDVNLRTEHDLKETIATELEGGRTRTLGLVEPFTEDELWRSPSQLMSPLVWDLGHCANYEELWLLRNIAGHSPTDPQLDDIYNAFEHPRWERPITAFARPPGSTRLHARCPVEVPRRARRARAHAGDPICSIAATCTEWSFSTSTCTTRRCSRRSS